MRPPHLKQVIIVNFIKNYSPNESLNFKGHLSLPKKFGTGKGERFWRLGNISKEGFVGKLPSTF